MPTIEFTTFDKNTITDFRPVLAKKFMPEWWRKAKIGMDVRGKKVTTIRACPAMDDWLKNGWYLVTNRDITVRRGYSENDHEGVKAWTVETGDYASPSHPESQLLGYVNYTGKNLPVNDAFKMRNPWNIVTPPGYSCLYLDPFLFQNPYFACWQGIIDTDTFNKNMDNAQIIFYPKVDHTFTIKQGTPLCQVLPYKREEWNASYIQYDHQSYHENRSYVTSHHGDGTMRWDDSLSMDEWGRRPGFDDETRKTKLTSGGYRKGAYWHPKGKLFDENNPPPECPFHKNDDSETPEKQLELDLGS